MLVSAGTTGGHLVIFDHFVYAPGWTKQTVGAGLFGPPSVATVYDHLDSQYLGLLTASSGGTLYFFWEYLATPGWHQQTVAAGSYTGGSVATSSTDIVIAAATTAGTVRSFTQPIGGTSWAAQTVSASGGPYTSPQAAWTGVITAGSYDVITAANRAGALHYWWKADG